MKNIILSVFAFVTFICNAQIVTVSGFGTFETFGSVTQTNTLTDILLDKSGYLPSEGLPIGYKYVIDFNSLECTLYDGNSEMLVTSTFKVIDKKSDRDFQIQFTGSELDLLENTYGLIVKDTSAAHFDFNGRGANLIVFDSFYIF